MTRVDELQKKYPGVPRNIIAKLDILSHGIRRSADLDKASVWARSGGGGSYQSYHRDSSLKDVIEEKAGSSRQGLIKRPPRGFYFKNGVNMAIQLDSTSPYQIREAGAGHFALCEGEQQIEDIYFLQPHQKAEEPVTSKGTPVSALINQFRVCFQISPVRYCEYFATGEDCKFCNYNATQDDARAVGLDRRVTIDLEETVEAYKIMSSNIRLVDGNFGMGGFSNGEQEAKIITNFVGRIASAASYKPNLKMNTQPMSRRNLQRLKESGLDCVSYQMEVWDPQLHREICPGKAKFADHERYKEAYVEAVDVLGAGNVRAVLVGGVTMIPPNGHKTWQKSRDSLIEGISWLMARGVITTYPPLRLGPGSQYGNDRANQAKQPPTEYYMDITLAHHHGMEEHGLYEKMNKLLFCPLECLELVYGGELGILERAGDMGKWLADTIPAESNWLAKFTASVNSPTAGTH